MRMLPKALETLAGRWRGGRGRGAGAGRPSEAALAVEGALVGAAAALAEAQLVLCVDSIPLLGAPARGREGGTRA